MAARAAAAQAGESTDDAGAGEDHEHLGLARKFLLGRPIPSPENSRRHVMLTSNRLLQPTRRTLST